MPLTAATPSLSNSQKLVLQGGPEKAFAEMVEMLRNLPANKGLTELTRKESSLVAAHHVCWSSKLANFICLQLDWGLTCNCIRFGFLALSR